MTRGKDAKGQMMMSYDKQQPDPKPAAKQQPYPLGFLAFANHYPRSHLVGVESVYRTWCELGLEQHADKIVAAVKWFVECNRKWKAGYIHGAKNFIENGMWKDFEFFEDVDRKRADKEGSSLRAHLTAKYPEHRDELMHCGDDRVTELGIWDRWRELKNRYGMTPGTVHMWMEWQKQRHAMGLRGPVEYFERPE